VRTERQDEIIRESLSLIAERGMEGLTYRNLSERFGISVPAFYRHFASKADIVRGVIEYLQEVSDQVFRDAETEGTDPVDTLRLVLVGYARRFAENGGLAAVLFPDEVGGNDRALQERILRHIEENQDRLVRLIGDGVAAGLVRSDLPAPRVAFFAMASLRLEVTRWRLGGRAGDLVERVEALWADLEVIVRPPEHADTGTGAQRTDVGTPRAARAQGSRRATRHDPPEGEQ
jgi:AcrR family transcriptional regulator